MTSTHHKAPQNIEAAIRFLVVSLFKPKDSAMPDMTIEVKPDSDERYPDELTSIVISDYEYDGIYGADKMTDEALPRLEKALQQLNQETPLAESLIMLSLSDYIEDGDNGYSETSLAQSPFILFQHPEDPKALYQVSSQLIKNGTNNIEPDTLDPEGLIIKRYANIDFLNRCDNLKRVVNIVSFDLFNQIDYSSESQKIYDREIILGALSESVIGELIDFPSLLKKVAHTGGIDNSFSFISSLCVLCGNHDNPITIPVNLDAPYYSEYPEKLPMAIHVNYDPVNMLNSSISIIRKDDSVDIVNFHDIAFSIYTDGSFDLKEERLFSNNIKSFFLDCVNQYYKKGVIQVELNFIGYNQDLKSENKASSSLPNNG